jgi:hypothetical protein
LPALLLAVSAACNHESDATGPLAERETQVPPANLGAIPTDPMLEIVSALIEAWTAKDASAYAALYAPDLQFVNPLGASIADRDAYRAQHEFLFNGLFAGSTLTLVSATSRF